MTVLASTTSPDTKVLASAAATMSSNICRFCASVVVSATDSLNVVAVSDVLASAENTTLATVQVGVRPLPAHAAWT